MPTSPLQRLAPLAGKPLVRRGFFTVVVLFLLYTLLGFFAVPAIVKHEAQKQASEKLHRELTIDRVRFNPFTLAMSVEGLTMKEPGGDAVFASFDTLDVNVSTKSLFRLAPVVQQIRLAKPYVHLVRTGENHYNIDDIIELIASQPPSPEPARFSINNIQLEGGTVEFEDQPVKATHKVSELTLGVPFVSSLPADEEIFVEPLLSAKVNDAPLLLKGRLRPFADTKEAVVDLDFDDVDLTRYLGYIPLQLKAKIPSARLDTKMTASFRQPQDKTPTLVLNGDAALKAVQVNDAEGKSVLKLPELALTLKEMEVFGGNYRIERIGITGLQADLGRDRDGRLNVQKLLPPSRPAAATKKADADAAPSPLMVNVGELDIRDSGVRYADEAQAMRAGIDKLHLALRRIAFDAGKNRLAIEEVSSDSADVQFKRNGAAAAAGPDTQEETRPATGKGRPFLAEVARLDIKNWSARVEDGQRADAAVTVIAPFQLAMQDISTAPNARGKLDLKATVNKNGQLAATGTLGITPLHANLALDAKGIDLQPIQPYIADKVNLRLRQAKASTRSKLLLDTAADGSLKGSFTGDASVDGFATVDRISNNEFLRWRSLAFSGVDVKLAPLAINVDRVALSDFFARIIIDPSGRINLQNIMRNGGDAHQSLTEEAERKPAAGKQDRPPKSAPASDKAATARVAEAAQSAAQEAAKAMPPIRIRQVTLRGGRVRFTDNFIQPNYSANMQDLGGTVTGLSSNEASNADVNLRGVVNNAPLSIEGRINPLKRDLFLDLKGNVRGMELAQLSAYSDKYVGYGIEKGKMSFEVSYLVDGKQLTASNRLMLDQLSFGRENPDPSIKKLPVRLAVALLADRNGVIDVNVPISGSLDDPEFSIGGIIWKIVGNLIVKAVTSPFSLLASAFGGSGGEQMSMIAFDPGRAAIPAGEEDKLQSLAKALNDRPGIKLDITGRYDPATDIEGMKLAAIERKVRALKVKDMQDKGQPIPEGGVTVGKEEYPELLWRVYKDEDFKKPRNMVGMQKRLPVEEMRSLMLANIKIGEEDLVSLGNRRAQAAKDWLVKNGVDAGRIFLIAPKARSEEEAKGQKEGSDAKAEAGASFSRVDFSLHG